MKIDIISLILGAILGAIPSWLITDIYSKKSDKANEIEVKKLKDFIKENSLQYEVVDEWKEEEKLKENIERKN